MQNMKYSINFERTCITGSHGFNPFDRLATDENTLPKLDKDANLVKQNRGPYLDIQKTATRPFGINTFNYLFSFKELIPN